MACHWRGIVHLVFMAAEQNCSTVCKAQEEQVR